MKVITLRETEERGRERGRDERIKEEEKTEREKDERGTYSDESPPFVHETDAPR